jgi:aspartyl-tRNA(Asn)/glutamyl-tRNA(Gln) amidotransferase subunit A
MNVADLDIRTARERIAAGELTSAALTEACLARIGERNPTLNAFITVTADEAMAAAERADTARRHGMSLGPLHGIPISLKDLIDQAGVPTTAGSRVPEARPALADAPVTAALKRAGAVLVGKCNLHEFAFGTTNEDSAFGPARHPIDPTRSPGGSSGGSAVAVATGMSLGSIGTDTGGSIRIPAAACGVVGLKPALGEISTEGVVPLSHTLDHVGPIARTVADAALMFEALTGRATRLDVPDRLEGLRFGVLGGYFEERLQPAVRAALRTAIETLEAAGASVETVTIAHADLIAPIYLAIVFSEAAAFHADTLARMPERYQPAVRDRLEVGRYVLAEDYLRAIRGRQVLTAAVDGALAGYDALCLPALAIEAPPLGAAAVDVDGTEESVRSITLRLTQLFDLTGHPAIAIPCGLTPAGLPCSLQLVGAPGATDRLLRTALACEAHICRGGAG